MIAPATLDEIRQVALPDLYPTGLLEDCDTALILFAAGFFGRQDGIFIADAGLTATCVDNDEQFLTAMQHVYPAGWEFVCANAYEYAASLVGTWDLVSVDCPTGAFERCADYLDVWCRLANRAVVLGTGPETPLSPPDGWEVTERRRRSDYAGGVCWAILEPA